TRSLFNTDSSITNNTNEDTTSHFTSAMDSTSISEEGLLEEDTLAELRERMAILADEAKALNKHLGKLTMRLQSLPESSPEDPGEDEGRKMLCEQIRKFDHDSTRVKDQYRQLEKS
ncbi:hypothetical protein BGZ65_003678, partial [Modicella reniformis]